jgi:hypothetical protein
MTEDIYKYNRAYYIRFRNIQNERYLTNYLFPNFAKILDVDVIDAIAIEEDQNGLDNMVVFLEDIKIEEFVDFCNDEDIIEQHYDISIDLMRGDEIAPVVQKMMNSDEFKEKFDRFFTKNLNVDLVLDKIMLYGKDSLTELDKQVLKREI